MFSCGFAGVSVPFAHGGGGDAAGPGDGPGAHVGVGPRAAYAVRGAVVPICGGYRGGDPTSPRCGKHWALCGAAAITAASPASVRRACVWWRDVLMGASCLRSGLSTWVCDPMVPCTWSSVCGATPAGSGAGTRVGEPQAVFGCGEWSDSEKGPAGHGGAGGTGQCAVHPVVCGADGGRDTNSAAD